MGAISLGFTSTLFSVSLPISILCALSLSPHRVTKKEKQKEKKTIQLRLEFKLIFICGISRKSDITSSGEKIVSNERPAVEQTID